MEVFAIYRHSASGGVYIESIMASLDEAEALLDVDPDVYCIQPFLVR